MPGKRAVDGVYVDGLVSLRQLEGLVGVDAGKSTDSPLFLGDGVKLLKDGELPEGVGVLKLGLLLEVLQVEGLVVYVLGAENEEIFADEGFEFGFGEVY